MPEHETPETSDQDGDQDASPRGALGALAQIIGAVALGLAVSLALLEFVVAPRLGFGQELSRVQAIAQRTAQPFEPRTLVVVSNSVGVEGIDAEAMQRAADSGWNVVNLSMNGTEVLSIQVLLSRVLAAEPDAVLWVIRPEAVGEPRSINPQMAKAFRYAGYTENVPWIVDGRVVEGAPPFLDAESVEALTASPATLKLAMRTTPLAAVNERVRDAFRDGWRPARPDNFVDPYFLTADITGGRLDRHVEETVSSVRERAGDPREPHTPVEPGDDRRAGVPLIAEIARAVRAAGAQMIFAVPPSHPDFRAIMRPYEREILGRLRDLPQAPAVIDATTALDGAGFADAIHPNAEGRERLSVFIGERLPAPARE